MRASPPDVHHLPVRRERDLNGIGFGLSHLPAFVQTDHRPSVHTHDVVEIAYIFAGRGEHRLGDACFPLRPGSLGIIHYTQPHVITTGGAPMSVVNLFLDLEALPLPDLGEELGRALGAILPRHPSLAHRRGQFVHLQFPPGGEQERLLEAMLAEQRARRPGYREALLGLLRLFLIACARLALASGRTRLPEVGETEARIEHLRRQLDLDPAAAVSVSALARRLGWSVPHLCRAFRRHTGMSIGAYRQRQRIHAAMLRLRAGDEGVLAVALACGFSDPSYFTRAFRRLVGTTPSAYRRQQPRPPSLARPIAAHAAPLPSRTGLGP